MAPHQSDHEFKQFMVEPVVAFKACPLPSGVYFDLLMYIAGNLSSCYLAYTFASKGELGMSLLVTFFILLGICYTARIYTRGISQILHYVQTSVDSGIRSMELHYLFSISAHMKDCLLNMLAPYGLLSLKHMDMYQFANGGFFLLLHIYTMSEVMTNAHLGEAQRQFGISVVKENYGDRKIFALKAWSICTITVQVVLNAIFLYAFPWVLSFLGWCIVALGYTATHHDLRDSANVVWRLSLRICDICLGCCCKRRAESNLEMMLCPDSLEDESELAFLEEEPLGDAELCSCCFTLMTSFFEPMRLIGMVQCSIFGIQQWDMLLEEDVGGKSMLPLCLAHLIRAVFWTGMLLFDFQGGTRVIWHSVFEPIAQLDDMHSVAWPDAAFRALLVTIGLPSLFIYVCMTVIQLCFNPYMKNGGVDRTLNQKMTQKQSQLYDVLQIPWCQRSFVDLETYFTFDSRSMPRTLAENFIREGLQPQEVIELDKFIQQQFAEFQMPPEPERGHAHSAWQGGRALNEKPWYRKVPKCR